MENDHRRPDEAGDGAVAAAGKMSEALETLERARGHLYSFHQLMGETDLKLDEVLGLLRADEMEALADELQRDLVGRNVLAGRWTFQVVEKISTTHTGRSSANMSRRCAKPSSAASTTSSRPR